MTAANPRRHAYSADVRMELRVNGHVFLIGQLGPDFVILDEPAHQPPGDAEITVSIDGRVRRWPVYLPEGSGASETRTRLAGYPPFRGSKVQ